MAAGFAGYEVIHTGAAPTGQHSGKEGQFPQRRWHLASRRLKNRRHEFALKFKFRPRAFVWIGPHRERKLKRNPARRPPSPFAAFQKARAGSGAKAKAPSRGWPTARTQPWGRQPGTEQAFSTAVFSDRTQPVCQVLHGQEAQPLCLMPAGKQEAYPFVAVVGLTSLRTGRCGHWLLSFIF